MSSSRDREIRWGKFNTAWTYIHAIDGVPAFRYLVRQCSKEEYNSFTAGKILRMADFLAKHNAKFIVSPATDRLIGIRFKTTDDKLMFLLKVK